MSTIHNPVNFEPADYRVEDYLDNQRPVYCGGPVEAFEQEVRYWEQDMARALGPDWRAKIHRCVHCHNGRVRYITAVRHLPTGDTVVFGADCTARLGFENRVAFKLAQVQARAEARRISFMVYGKRQAFLAAHPAVAEAIAQIANPVHARNIFAHDVLSKLDRFGELSDRQATAVVASLARDIEFAARRAAEDALPKGAAPAGRQTVSGVVVSVREYESSFGVSLKMTIKLDSNARVWMTVPGGSGIDRGDRVTVKATFTVSDTDPSFAFGKRPTLVSIVAGDGTSHSATPADACVR